MRIAVLTTDTHHHTYFVREVMKAFPIEVVLDERNVLHAPFKTAHPFELVRETYERDALFGGRELGLGDVGETLAVSRVNDPVALRRLREAKPDTIVVFGTGKVSPEVIGICPRGIVNLHGGDPEEYRGLDSHLWAIYHRDFRGLVTTLHHLNEEFDDGDIILQGAVPVCKGMALHEIRRYNTEVCVELALAALDMFARSGHFVSRPQRKLGRYYSFMPADLKEVCRTTFQKHADGLP